MMRPAPPPPFPKGQRGNEGRAAGAGPNGGNSQSATYWQAQEEAYLFAGPLGEVVGEIEAGTVVREAKRYQDVFGGWWIATRASAPTADEREQEQKNEKKTILRKGKAADKPPQQEAPEKVLVALVWISYNNSQLLPLEALDAAPPSWVQVYVTPEEKSSPLNRASVYARLAQKKATPLSPTNRGGGSNGGSGSPIGSSEVQRSSQRADGSEVDSELPEQDARPIPPLNVKQQRSNISQGVVKQSQLYDLTMGKVPGLPADLDLFTYYWDKVAGQQESTLLAASWNQRYQMAVEDALFHGSGVDAESLRKAQMKLHTMLDDFSNTCQQLATQVVEQMLSMPDSRRSASEQPLIPHETLNKTVFYAAQGLVVRLCCDTADGFFGGEAKVQKFALRQFQGVKLLAQVAPRHLMCTPLSAMVDFEGYRCAISSIPPVCSSAGCVYAPLRASLSSSSSSSWHGGGDAADDTPAVVEKLLALIAQDLNLKMHSVSVKGPPERSWLTALPLESEVYAGRDRRLYLLHASRLTVASHLPSTEHQRLQPQEQPLVSTALSSFRPEFLLGCDSPVNMNLSIEGCCEDAHRCDDAWAVANHVKAVALTQAAGMIGLHLPLPVSLQLPTVTCKGCSATVDSNELRFVVCRSPQRCCHVCVDCYVKAVVTDAQQEQSHPSEPVFKAAVMCWQSKQGARPLSGLALQPSVTDLLHANGVNVRFLGYVYNRLPTTARPFMGHYAEVEMVARAASQLLKTVLRAAATAEDAKRTIEGFFTALLQSTGPRTERLWAKDLGPLIEKMFPGIVEPFSTRHLSKELIIERMQELTGIVFTQESVASFSKFARAHYSPSTGSSPAAVTAGGNSGGGGKQGGSEELPFLQLQSVSPRVRMATPGGLVSLSDKNVAEAEENAREDVELLESRLESALLFWIGYAPEGSLDALQPKYLEKIVTAAAAAAANSTAASQDVC